MKNNKMICGILTCITMLTMFMPVFATEYLDPVNPSLPGGSDIVSGVLGLIQGLGVGVACGMIFYVGIKYTMASANEKADLKNSSIKYVIGAIILFTLTSTFSIIVNVMNGIGG